MQVPMYFCVIVLNLGFFIYAPAAQKITCIGTNRDFWSWHSPSLKKMPEMRSIHIIGTASENNEGLCLISQKDRQLYCASEKIGSTLRQFNTSRIHTFLPRQGLGWFDILGEDGIAYSLAYEKVTDTQNQSKMGWVQYFYPEVKNKNGFNLGYRKIFQHGLAIDAKGNALYLSFDGSDNHFVVREFPTTKAELPYEIIYKPYSFSVVYHSGKVEQYKTTNLNHSQSTTTVDEFKAADVKISAEALKEIISSFSKKNQKKLGQVAEEVIAGKHHCMRFTSGKVGCRSTTLSNSKFYLKQIQDAISISVTEDRICALEDSNQFGGED